MKITDQNFEIEIKKLKKPLLVDFFAEWCGPCRALSPVLEKIAEKEKDRIDFLKINVDEFPQVSQKLGIQSIPTVVLFKNGEAVSGFLGMQQEEEIINWLKDNLKTEELELEKLIEEYEKYALENGFKLNPDKEIVKSVLTGLLKNKQKYGEKYCPCRRVEGDKEKDSKKICPCEWHKKEIKELGHCLCLLFVK